MKQLYYNIMIVILIVEDHLKVYVLCRIGWGCLCVVLLDLVCVCVCLYV